MTTRFESAEGGGAGFVVEKGKYIPYPAYRDSGVEWLGVIPSHWEVRRLKRVATWNDEVLPDWTDPDLELTYVDIGSVDALDGIVEKSYLRFGSAPTRARRVVRDGDVIVSTVRTYLRAIASIVTPDSSLIVSTGFAVIRPRDIDSSFAAYAVRTPYFVENVVANSVGVNYPAINAGELVLLPVVCPTSEEQSAISTFLDRETAKLDALVAKKERLIELLQEKRTALITRAVTKGLDADVPTKDSGVEWVGEIPAHWEMKQLKRWASSIQTGSTPPTNNARYFSDGTVPWHGPSSFSSALLLRPAVRMISENAIRERVARIFGKECSMIVTIGATIGRVGFVDKPSSCNQQITAVEFDSTNMFAKYGGYQLKRLEPMLSGIAPRTTLPILSRDQVGYFPFSGPPMSEQRAIAAYLDRETARIDALAAKVQEAIERLRELRTALISAAVTGKIDVRETAV